MRKAVTVLITRKRVPSAANRLIEERLNIETNEIQTISGPTPNRFGLICCRDDKKETKNEASFGEPLQR